MTCREKFEDNWRKVETHEWTEEEFSAWFEISCKHCFYFTGYSCDENEDNLKN